MSHRRGARVNPVFATVVMVAIIVVLAAVLYMSVGGCAYTGPSAWLYYHGAQVAPADLADAITTWNRTTYVGYANGSSSAHFDLTCDGRDGHGWARVASSDGGPNSTVEVFVYERSERPRPYDWWHDPFGPSVESTFARDRTHFEPCVTELSTLLSAPRGGPPDVTSWRPFGLC